MQKIEITTEEFEVSFPSLDKHEEFDGTSTGKYSITMKFDKGSEGHKQLKAAADEVHNGGKYYPLKDGKGDYDDGKILCKAKSKFEVRCVGSDREDIPRTDIHHGDICRARIAFSTWEKGSNSGTACYLQAVQKVRSGGFTGFEKVDEEDTDLPF